MRHPRAYDAAGWLRSHSFHQRRSDTWVFIYSWSDGGSLTYMTDADLARTFGPGAGYGLGELAGNMVVVTSIGPVTAPEVGH